VRSDENGRELRMGERRQSVRSDGRGTEMRVEDRWAVRRENPNGVDQPDVEWDLPYTGRGQAALPPAPGESPRPYITPPPEHEPWAGPPPELPRQRNPYDPEGRR
jgi:hypothetical protein